MTVRVCLDRAACGRTLASICRSWGAVQGPKAASGGCQTCLDHMAESREPCPDPRSHLLWKQAPVVRTWCFPRTGQGGERHPGARGATAAASCVILWASRLWRGRDWVRWAKECFQPCTSIVTSLLFHRKVPLENTVVTRKKIAFY